MSLIVLNLLADDHGHPFDASNPQEALLAKSQPTNTVVFPSFDITEKAEFDTVESFGRCLAVEKMRGLEHLARQCTPFRRDRKVVVEDLKNFSQTFKLKT
jgi:hypothetical protein